MDDPALPARPADVADSARSGPLSRDQAVELIDRGASLMATGDFADAQAVYARVVGFDDPDITAAALLGVAQSRYRMDDETGAVRTWEAILELPETPSTYYAWREIAAARVRDGDLQGAIAAYREADRRAPLADKPEIANRLGWLAKETGNVRASRRYFARGRGAGSLVQASLVILGLTVAVSLSSVMTVDGSALFGLLQLDKPAVAHGELWRLWTVTLLHDPSNLLHLLFNMYALYLAGPVVERMYGAVLFVAFYLLCAAGGSIASFAFGPAPLGVGASGAIFGLFGVLLVATRVHHPVIDRQSRAFVGQLGTILMINVVFGLVAGGRIDNAAHAGGFLAGAVLGLAFVPGHVPTLSSVWQRPVAGPTAAGAGAGSAGRSASTGARIVGPLAGLLVLAVGLVAGYAVGLGTWG